MGERCVGSAFRLQGGIQALPSLLLCAQKLDRLFQVPPRLLVVALADEILFLRSRLPGHLKHL